MTQTAPGYGAGGEREPGGAGREAHKEYQRAHHLLGILGTSEKTKPTVTVVITKLSTGSAIYRIFFY